MPTPRKGSTEVVSSNSAPRRTVTNAVTRIMTKIMISLVFGLGAFGLAQVLDSSTEGPILLAVGTSVFVSGVAFVVQFLMDVEGRIDHVEVRIDRVETRIDELNSATVKVVDRYEENSEKTAVMIREQFQKINAATKLFGAVEESALRIDETTQLVRDATTVMQNPSRLVSRFAHGEITRLARYLKALGHGSEVSYVGEDRDWLLGLTAVAEVSIHAISLTTVDAGGQSFMDGGLWNSDLGEKYLAVQQEAARRGVSVRRVFVFDRPEFQDDRDLVSILRKHLDAGVEVRTFVPRPNQAALTDFIVIDGELSYQSLPASTHQGSRPIIATTTLVTDLTWVRNRTSAFDELWKVAGPFVDEAEPGHEGTGTIGSIPLPRPPQPDQLTPGRTDGRPNAS